MQPSPSILTRAKGPLPNEYDFNPGGSRAGAAAWECFGGLTLEQAYHKLASDPVRHEEEFAHMGRVAFDYYFPVIDRFIRGADPKDHDDHREVRALGYTIAAQLVGPIEPQLESEISDLTEYVLGNLRHYAHNKTGQKKVSGAWHLVRKKLSRS